MVRAVVDSAAAAPSSSPGGVGITRFAMTANDVVVRGGGIAGVPAIAVAVRVSGDPDRTRAAGRGGGGVAERAVMVTMMGGSRAHRGVHSGDPPAIHDGREMMTGMMMGATTIVMTVDADDDGG